MSSSRDNAARLRPAAGDQRPPLMQCPSCLAVFQHRIELEKHLDRRSARSHDGVEHLRRLAGDRSDFDRLLLEVTQAAEK
ncbi:hypothetical protein KL930_001530 [Ogataea haglerorum]|nr:hypothetical protein KL951_002016 [Ogataea haglerorum]KAG7713986.1 hypothetical protein KL913_004677 [Ogataea haglerorum]KAG7714480.1 hypothetical protein KL949_004716 [Ogataea haglerorum]KAG7726001.1 hypothetical protein KL948_004736 [Ogataea haglerorum]KAG7736229.1 hypothetical protein KL923_004938 [Ogataea haglerorum]